MVDELIFDFFVLSKKIVGTYFYPETTMLTTILVPYLNVSQIGSVT